MMRSPTLKLAGFALCLGMPLLTPLGIREGSPWLAAIVVFGLFPILGLLIGEDHSLPMVGLLFAAVFAEIIGPRTVFLALGVIALLALPVAVRLPSGPPPVRRTTPRSHTRCRSPTTP